MHELNIGTEPPACSGYPDRVREIAPSELRGRTAELAEMDEFCTAPEVDVPFLWWRGPAWAGKSALMSWFVLHPPPGVRIVSFFVTARYASQNDRASFVDVVAEQLAEILGRPTPRFASAATRESSLLTLVRQAAASCRKRHERLILLVDGLDEDRGVVTGPEARSIAALLPTRPDDGMRILLSGRPDPPIPADVPDWHPVRDPAIVRSLRASPFAQVVRHDAERELDRLLEGTSAEKDLLGVLTAAGGGLSGADLAALTGSSLRQVEKQLCTVSGRTFSGRAGQWRSETPVYVLAHEELQVRAAAELADELPEIRRRLHEWAEGYRRERWPSDTPEYLLRDYFRLLDVTGDVAAMLVLATDPDRHARMLDITGGDSAALNEIATVGERIRRAGRPDLVALGRLAVHRRVLTMRNENMPVGLPKVWARLGFVERAEALARCLPDVEQQAVAMAEVAAAVSVSQPDRMRGVARRGEALARSLTNEDVRERVLVDLAVGTAASDVETAVSTAQSIQDASRRIEALTGIATAVAHTDRERALVVARSVTDSRHRAIALAGVMGVIAGDDPDEAVRLAEAVNDPLGRAEALGRIAVALAPTDPDRAEELVRSIGDPLLRNDAVRALAVAIAPRVPRRAEMLARSTTGAEERSEALARVAVAMATTDHSRATTIARSIPHPRWRAEGMAALSVVSERRPAIATESADVDNAPGTREPRRHVEALTAAAAALVPVDPGSARILAGAAEDLARSLTEADRQEQLLSDIAVAVAPGDPAQAEVLARAIVGRRRRAETLIGLAKAAATTDPAYAEALACSVDYFWKIEALTAVAAVDLTSSRTLADRAVALASTMGGVFAQAEATARIAVAIAAADPDRAEALARSVTNSQWAPEALAGTAAVIAAHDADRAADLVRAIRNPHRRAEALADVAAIVADRDADRGEALALSIPYPYVRAMAVAKVAVAIARQDPARGERLILLVSDRRHRAGELAALEAVDRRRAERLRPALIPANRRADVLSRLAVAVAATDPARAEALIASIDDPQRSVEARAGIVATIAGSHPERAEAVARSIADPLQQASALAVVASAIRSTPRARVLLGEALHTGDLGVLSPIMAQLEPAAAAAVAAEIGTVVDHQSRTAALTATALATDLTESVES
ncbi:hypothetical protein [Actinoplanes sp. NPDC049681]|uniref:hypothetical protein n=1 Tax=Actinoplanes sp. NPDC049681 TaxID=3363905 RepID=UPI0037981521